MDPFSVIVGALIAGALSGVEAVASETVKEAYGLLKARVKDFVAPRLLEKLEQAPTEAGRQDQLLQALTPVKEELLQVPGLHEQAESFLKLLEAEKTPLPKAADILLQEIRSGGGINLEGIRLGNTRLEVKGAAATGDFNLRDVIAISTRDQS